MADLALLRHLGVSNWNFLAVLESSGGGGSSQTVNIDTIFNESVSSTITSDSLGNLTKVELFTDETKADKYLTMDISRMNQIPTLVVTRIFNETSSEIYTLTEVFSGDTLATFKSEGVTLVTPTQVAGFVTLSIADANADNIEITDAIYLSSSGLVQKCDASALASSRVVGFVSSINVSSKSCLVQITGDLGGFTGLSVNSDYYLAKGSASAGEVTATIPTDTGDIFKFVGVASSSTILSIDVVSRELVIRG